MRERDVGGLFFIPQRTRTVPDGPRASTSRCPTTATGGARPRFGATCTNAAFCSVVASVHKTDGARPRQKPTGSTRFRATQRRQNTNAWITGREAHKNARTNANATLIYSLKQVDPSTLTLRSREARRAHETCSRGGHGGTGAQRATVLEQESPVAPATDQVTLFHWKRYLAHRVLGQPGLVSLSKSQGT